MFDEAVGCDQGFEVRHRDVVVVYISGLAWTRRAGGVRDGGCEEGGVGVEEEFVERAFAHA